jgi:hypothetical protein
MIQTNEELHLALKAALVDLVDDVARAVVGELMKRYLLIPREDLARAVETGVPLEMDEIDPPSREAP